MKATNRICLASLKTEDEMGLGQTQIKKLHIVMPDHEESILATPFSIK